MTTILSERKTGPWKRDFEKTKEQTSAVIPNRGNIVFGLTLAVGSSSTLGTQASVIFSIW